MKLKKLNINYTQIPNELLYCDGLSLKAKGLFAYMQAKPDNWEFSYERIAIENIDGEKSVLSGLKELEDKGYLKRDKYKNEKGQWEWEHTLQNPLPQNPDSEKRDTEKRRVEKGDYNKEINNNKDNKERVTNSKSGDLRVYKPSKDEVVLIIEAMSKHIDPKNKLYYGNTSQRNACRFLIDTYTFEVVMQTIEAIPTIKDNVSYFPDITTPCELRDKWQKAINATKRESIKNNSKVNENMKNMIW